MNKKYNPSTIAPPVSETYSHACEYNSSQRVLHISGQIGQEVGGGIGTTTEDQTEQIFRNIEEILKAASMSYEDIVKINSYLLPSADIKAFLKVRAKYLGANKPAMTAIFVPALISESWLLEVEVVAAL